MTLKEFNIRFLLATQRYKPSLARALVRECREDIETMGLEKAQRKWSAFIGMEIRKEPSPALEARGKALLGGRRSASLSKS